MNEANLLTMVIVINGKLKWEFLVMAEANRITMKLVSEERTISILYSKMHCPLLHACTVFSIRNFDRHLVLKVS